MKIFTLRGFAWGGVLIFCGGLAFGINPHAVDREPPTAVISAVELLKTRAGLSASSPTAEQLKTLLVTNLDSVAPENPLSVIPDVQAPGCAYGNSVTSAMARITDDPEAYYKTGLSALMENRLSEADFYFTQLRELSPTHPLADNAAFWIGEIKRKEEKNAEALVAYEKVTGELRPEADFRYAWLCEREGRTADALRMWGQVASTQGHPHRARAKFRLGYEELAAGNFAGAVSLFDEARSGAQPGSDLEASSVFLLALSQRGAGRYEEAQKELQTLLQTRPDHPVSTPARLLLAWVELARDNVDQAKPELETLAANAINSQVLLGSRYGLMRAEVMKGSDEGVRLSLDALLRQSSEARIAGWSNSEAGYRDFTLQKYESAVNYFKTALAGWPQGEDLAPVTYLLAESQLRQGLFGEAEATFLSAPKEGELAPYALFGAGRSALMAEATERAITHFKALTDNYPGFAEAGRVWTLAGEAELALGRPENARQDFEAVDKASPFYPTALYNRALIEYDMQKWDRTGELLSQFIDANPDSPMHDKAMLLLAKANEKKGSMTVTFILLSDLSKGAKTPEIAEEADYLAPSFQKKAGRVKEARTGYEKYLTKYPAGAFANKAQFDLAQLSFEARSYDKALEGFKAVVALDRGGQVEAEARRKIVACLTNLGRFDESLKALANIEQSADQVYTEAELLAKLKKPKELSKLIDEFAKSYPSDARKADLYEMLAKLYEEELNFVAASDAYLDLAQETKNKRSAEARLNAAKNLFSAGKVEEALKEYNTVAATGGPTGQKALGDLAEIHEKRQDFKSAVTAYSELASKEADPKVSSGYYHKAGKLSKGLGEFEAADGLLTLALTKLDSKKNSPREILSDLGENLMAWGKPQDALKPLARAANLGEGDGALRARWLYAKALLATGDKAGAQEMAEKVSYLYPSNDPMTAEALVMAGDLILEGGKTETAKAFYKKAEAGGDPTFAPIAKQKLEVLEGR